MTGAATISPNNKGWYNTDVTAHFTAEDAQSGLDTVTPDQTLTAEGAGQFVTGTALASLEIRLRSVWDRSISTKHLQPSAGQRQPRRTIMAGITPMLLFTSLLRTRCLA